jgi:hypothetical protein
MKINLKMEYHLKKDVPLKSKEQNCRFPVNDVRRKNLRL